MKDLCDCIIPFYNEGARVLRVVGSIVKVKNISKIIVVDDGSADRKTYGELKAKFPQVTSVRLENNTGKPNAIRMGLQHITTPYVLLLDGDLSNIKAQELDNAIHKIINSPNIDMIILRRSKDTTSLAWMRQDIVTSGQRILKRQDLENVFADYPRGYQLEWAVNTYMIKKKKKVYWVPFSIHNLWRHQKYGLRAGWKTYWTATVANLRVGIPNLIWQTLFFCRDEAPEY